MIQYLTPRLINWLLAGITVLALLVVYYLDGVLGLEPCPLCITQRVLLVGSGCFSLAAAVHHPGVLSRRVYAGCALLFAAVGAAVAGRHVWLQYLPEDQVPACGPGLAYMLEAFPFSKTLELVLMGDGNCAEVVWTFLGLSIPEQALLLFAAMCAANVWQLVRRPHQPGR